MSGEKIEITVWIGEHPFPGYADPVKAMAERFNEAHPGYHVNVEGRDYEAIPQDIAALAQAGQPLPALSEYYYTSTQTARDTVDASGVPVFTSIQQAIGGRTEILGEPVLIDDIVPAVRGYYTHQGDLVSLPATATTTLLYANKNLLAKAGITELPRTWGEVEAACKTLKALPDGPATGITWPVHGWFFQQALAQQGALLADQDNGHAGRATKLNLTSPQVLAYVDWWRRLSQEGHYQYSGTQEDWYACLDAFAGQQAAFLLCTSKLTPELGFMAAEAGFEMEVGWLPHNEHGPYAGAIVSGQSLWLANGLSAVKRDLALAFSQFLINAENAVAWHKAHGYVPITHASFESLAAEGWFDEFPQHRVSYDQLVASDCSPAALGAQLGDFAGIQEAITEAMEDVLVNGADPAARFAQAQAQAQRHLDAHNTHCTGGVVRRSPTNFTVR
jgi:sn-glycerol 3-phosphate transport system substrate-binding protein